MVDEILFQSEIHPCSTCQALTNEDWTRVYDSMRYISQTAVQCILDHQDFPKCWLFHYRWDLRKKKSSNAATSIEGGPHHGKSVSFTKVGGRTSAFVAQVQRIRKRARDMEEEQLPKDKKKKKVN